MGRVIENPDFRRARTGTRYPWDTWLDGQARELTRGEDFTQDIAAVGRAAYSIAKARGMKVRIHKTSPDSILLQGYTPS